LFLSSRVHKTRFIDAVGLGPNLELGPSLFACMSFTQCATRILDAFFPRGLPFIMRWWDSPFVPLLSNLHFLLFIWLDPTPSWMLSCDPFKKEANYFPFLLMGSFCPIRPATSLCCFLHRRCSFN
jgi:hypothetical protein